MIITYYCVWYYYYGWNLLPY